MTSKIDKIQIKSNNICYGPEPLPTDEVEQILTLTKTGQVCFNGYIYEGGFSNFRHCRHIVKNIGQEATELIFKLVSKWTNLDELICATDVGFWEMTIIDDSNNTYVYNGALIEDLNVDGIPLSRLIRNCINIENLFVFDGNTEESDNKEEIGILTRANAEIVVKEFLDLYKEYGIVEYSNNSNELVAVIADSMVFYIKYDVTCNFMDFADNRNWYLADGVCGIDIEELTPNTILPKYRHTPFMKQLSDKLGINTGWVRYGRFRGVEQKYLANGLTSQANYVIKNYPQVELKKRHEIWPGEAYNIVIFELTDSVGNIEYAADAIKGQVHPFVLKVADKLITQSYGYSEIMGFGLSEFNHVIDKNFLNAFRSHKGARLVARLQDNLKYFSFPSIFIKKEIDVRLTVERYLKDVKAGKHNTIERISYIKPEYRWKTEEYVYKIVKKIYKDQGVIYQHRPMFLHSSFGGQMSYDIYISGLKTAIEYQGKQHFEPIDYFGGEEAFKKLQQRDMEKQELSKKNGVRLIYINYWENITPELIQERINN